MSRIKNIIAVISVWIAAAIVLLAPLWLLADIARRGIGGVSWRFLVSAPADAGRGGGIGPIIVSTTLIVAVCIAVSVPLGIAAAALLSESRGDRRFGRFVRRSLDVLASVPSIVFGLFGNALFCTVFGLGYSILSGGLTLACMVLPLFIRTTESAFRAVPDEHRRAAAALGLSRATTLLRVILPAAGPGLAAGLVLGLGRALAETAALIFTSGYVDRSPTSLLDSGRALSVHIYDLAMNVPGGEANAYATALTLIVALVVVNHVTVSLVRRVAS